METDRAWQLDLAGARAYEQHLVPALMQPWADRLVDTVGLQPGELVLDLACGTGIVARHAAQRVGPLGTVDGVDVNPSMLAVAREVMVGRRPEIRWHEAAAEDLPFDAATFDVALCQQGMQFFADRVAALSELHRIVRPGGRVGISTCRSIEHQSGYAILADVVSAHLGADAGAIVRSPYALGDLAELRASVQRAGFADVHVHIDLTPVRAASPRALLEAETMSSPLGDVVAALDEAAVRDLVDDLGRALAPHVDDDGVVFPFETLVLTATR